MFKTILICSLATVCIASLYFNYCLISSIPTLHIDPAEIPQFSSELANQRELDSATLLTGIQKYAEWMNAVNHTINKQRCIEKDTPVNPTPPIFWDLNLDTMRRSGDTSTSRFRLYLYLRDSPEGSNLPVIRFAAITLDEQGQEHEDGYITNLIEPCPNSCGNVNSPFYRCYRDHLDTSRTCDPTENFLCPSTLFH